MIEEKLKKYKDEILFVPLGGANEIGMNLNVYCYKGKLLIVDVGMGFVDDAVPGIDVMFPKIDFLISQAKNIVGIILTHAHEDHIGGVPYLLSEINVPIYASSFTAEMLKAKLREFYSIKDEYSINTVAPGEKLNLQPFNIEFFQITHSIPENHSLIIRTNAGCMFHTGDWKFDKNPVIGDVTNEAKLKALGDDGVLAIVCDSTNVFNEGESSSEGDLKESLESIISTKAASNTIFITTFASNIGRMQSIIGAAQNANRKVALIGRSLWRTYNIAKDLGYMSNFKDPMTQDEALKCSDKEKLLVICTGCQGESRAALMQMIDKKSKMQIKKNDVVIFASKIIPGNEKKIFAMINKLALENIDVLTEKDHFVHVSGHPGRAELSKMYDLIRPKISIPVHGEAAHIREHANFVKGLGCKNVIKMKNGEVALIAEKNPGIIGFADSGYVFVDGSSIIDSMSPIIKMRSIMRDSGAVFVSLRTSKNKVVDFTCIAPGLLDENYDSDIMKDIKMQLSEILKDTNVINAFKKSAQSFIKKFSKKNLGKNPAIFITHHE
ncbi:MAG: ribonuclease J [Proteobacteria bacterium]|nr:ribonuclease J [Pseudomonadota bacterium]